MGSAVETAARAITTEERRVLENMMIGGLAKFGRL
jgi:hypothetical protein